MTNGVNFFRNMGRYASLPNPPVKNPSIDLWLATIRGNNKKVAEEKKEPELQEVPEEGLLPMPSYLEPVDRRIGASKVQAPGLPPLPADLNRVKHADNNGESNLDSYINSIADQNVPQVQALQEYLDNYKGLTEDAFNIKRFYTAYSGLSGNPGYQKLADQFDPRVIEKDRIKTIDDLQKQKVTGTSAVNELIGNAEMAKALGMPEETAMANKDWVNAFRGILGSQYNLEGKQYASNLGYNARIYQAQLDAETKRAIKEGDWATALRLQDMKGRIATQVAGINQAWAGVDPEVMVQIIDRMGNPGGLSIDTVQRPTGTEELTPIDDPLSNL